MHTSSNLVVAVLVILGSWGAEVCGQVECTGTGNLRGIRVDGELMAFGTSIRAVVPSAAGEGQGGRPRGAGGQFSREGGALIVTGRLSGGPGPGDGQGGDRARGGTPVSGAGYRATYRDVAPGTVDADIQLNAAAGSPVQGVEFVFVLPGTDYAGGSARLVALAGAAEPSVSLPASGFTGPHVSLRATARGVRVDSPRRQFALDLPAPAELVVRDVRNRGKIDLEISFPLGPANLAGVQTARSTCTIKATGEVDRSPARLVLDPSRPGRKYDGMGGNFRLQSPADAAQIQYNLDHLRVAWGRVAMPLDRWQPDENTDPVEAAASGTLSPSVRAATEMAQKLARQDIPTIISIWSAPRWAVTTSGSGRGGRGRIHPEKWDKVVKCIGSYIEYMKQHYGAEPVLFSFNESDMGIDVLQSPQEHADAIKRLGAYFVSRGLKTRMLLGDTGNPTGGWFIDVAMKDPEATRHVGAVSFHSWHGGTVEQYTHFSAAARQLDLPLLVAEGGLDPSAHQYRAIFREPWFCLDEIAQYVEICRIAQPLSILHWQLTADYSILTGGTGGRPLQPAQRFWQMKQLGMTATASAAVPITCDNPKVVSCAFEDKGAFVVHLVNRGASRKVSVSGFPGEVKELRAFVTDGRRGFQELARIPVIRGTAQAALAGMSFTSLAMIP